MINDRSKMTYLGHIVAKSMALWGYEKHDSTRQQLRYRSKHNAQWGQSLTYSLINMLVLRCGDERQCMSL